MQSTQRGTQKRAITLTTVEQSTLTVWSQTEENHKLATRAKIVLMVAGGTPPSTVCETLKVKKAVVDSTIRWFLTPRTELLKDGSTRLRMTRSRISPGPGRGRKTGLSIILTPEDRETLLRWHRSTTISAGRARRGRMIVMLADGYSISYIAVTVDISRRFVYKWAKRFRDGGIDGLADKPGRGHRPAQKSLTPAVAAAAAVA